MSRENRNLLINLGVALVLSFLFLFAFRAFNPSHEKVLFSDGESFKSVDFVKYDYVTDKIEVKKDGKVIGYIYEAAGKNDYSNNDSVTVMIGITKAGRITGIELIKLPQSDFVLKDIAKNVTYYKGKLIDGLDLNVLNSDTVTDYELESGATVGTSLIRKMLREAIFIHKGEEPVSSTIYEDIYGAGASNTVDSTFVGTSEVTQKEEVKLNDVVVGYAYTVTSTRNSADVDGFYYGTVDWGLTLLVGLDTEGNIKGIKIVESDHTNGFINYHLSYFELLIDQPIASYDSIDNTVTGATFSKVHIEDLLQALKGALA